jgi:hypothetical protein
MRPTSHWLRARVAIATVVASIVTAFGASSALAAPVLGLDIAHTPNTLPRSDQFLRYQLTVTNRAPATAPAVGAGLVCNARNWFPGAVGFVPSFTYQWLRNGVVIAGATGQTYTTTPSDAGTAVQCRVTGTNAAAAVSIASLPAAVVDPPPATAPPAPASPTVAGSRPTIAGTGSAMRTCTAPANWTAGTTYTFQWLRNSHPIAGATGNTYTPDAGPGGLDVDKVLQCQVVGTNAGGAIMGISNGSIVGTVSQPPSNGVGQTPAVLVNATTGSPVTVRFTLPHGMRVAAVGRPDDAAFENIPPTGWNCSIAHPVDVTCTRTDFLGPQASYPVIDVRTSITGEPFDPATAIGEVSGGGAPMPGTAVDNLSFTPGLPFGIAPSTFLARALNPSGADYTQAGGHPTSGILQFSVNTRISPGGDPIGIDHIRTATSELPAGFVGNPQAIPEVCEAISQVIADAFANPSCPRGSIVGGVTAHTGSGAWERAPLYAVQPERGAPAQFMFGFPVVQVVYSLVPRLRPEAGYAIKIEAPAIAKDPVLFGIDVTLCGYGTNVAEHGFGPGFLTGTETGFVSCKQPTDPDANPVPILTNPPACGSSPPVTRLRADSWENPGVFDVAEDEAPALTGCDQVEFSPTAQVSPSSSTRDSASGLDADISVPDDGLLDPDGLSQAHLKKTVVTLPEGVSVNPSGATGLKGCSDEQLRLGTDDPVSCPDGSKIGRVEIETPLLEEHLFGDMVLRTPRSTDPESGDMLRLAIVAESEERGILVKLPGTATADSETGRLEATFDQNPQLPFTNLRVRLKSGSKGVLATPQDCVQGSTLTVLTPWGQPPVVSSQTPFGMSGDCSLGFAPRLEAGMDNPAAGGSGSFSFRFSREDGEQWFESLIAELPEGLLASVRDVPLCSDAQAAAGACPASSRIGTVDAAAGTGDAFVLERKGDAFLTEGYKGCAYGLMVKVPVVAGPFDGSSPENDLGNIVVRQAVCVDRATAEVSAISDPFPTIWHGIPLRLRSVTVKVDRPGFMRNPTSCAPKAVSGHFRSVRGTGASAGSHFQVAGCAQLPLRPRLSMRLTGRRQVADGRHPGLRAVLRQAAGQANLKRVSTRLPLSLALDPERAQSDDLCEFEESRKDDPNCPASSIIGRARAFSPLLNRPLEGPVYFAKNVRFHPRTGNPIRTLPTLLLELSGEIDLNVRATTEVDRGKLVTTFPAIPDAPVQRVDLNLKGGREGILVVTNTNLCRRPKGHVTEVDTDGQNGRRHDFDIRMKTPCREKRRSRLRIGRVAWRGDKVAVAGRTAAVAGGKVRVSVRCGKRAARKVARIERGRWRTTVDTGGRCSKATIVAHYPGSPKARAQSVARTVRKAGPGDSSTAARAAMAAADKVRW